jgi:hypothetical protein
MVSWNGAALHAIGFTALALGCAQPVPPPVATPANSRVAGLPPADAAAGTTPLDPPRPLPVDCIEPAAIRLVIQQNRDAFLKCYEDHLSRGYGPNLQDRVTIRFVIGLDGGVRDARDAGSNVPDNEAVACVVRAMSELRFPHPLGGSQTVTYPIRFTPEGQ